MSTKTEKLYHRSDKYADRPPVRWESYSVGSDKPSSAVEFRPAPARAVDDEAPSDNGDRAEGPTTQPERAVEPDGDTIQEVKDQIRECALRYCLESLNAQPDDTSPHERYTIKHQRLLDRLAELEDQQERQQDK